jgi:PBSX family phage terminase large subunit
MQTFDLHKYQEQAFKSTAKVIAMSAGIQSGKTLTGALWSGTKAIQAASGLNTIICAPTYKILQQATLPGFLQIYGKHGNFHRGDFEFTWNHGVKTFVRSLTDPNAMEGITDVDAVHLDEGGLISRYAWENVEGRAAFRQAQVLITTTPYALNWLYRMWLDWEAGQRDDVEFIQFKSTDNPYFPQAEYERQKKLLDPRRFAMKYEGQFGKMEGLVFEDINICQAHALPEGTRYFAGVDWGFTNPTVITIRGLTPDGTHFRVAEFYKTQMTIEDTVRVCQQRMQIYNIELFVCDPSSPHNIDALNRGGCPAMGGVNDIRAGIDRQIELFKTDKLFIFESENPLGIDEYSTYHYGEPKELKIDDDAKEQLPIKANDHGIDADRYITMYLTEADLTNQMSAYSPTSGRPEHPTKRLEWLKRGGSSRNA